MEEGRQGQTYTPTQHDTLCLAGHTLMVSHQTCTKICLLYTP